MSQSIPLLIKVVANSVKCASSAGKIIKDIINTGNLNIIDKGINDLQTEADRRAQRSIINSLNFNFPKIKIIGEEVLNDKTPMKDEWLIKDFDDDVLSKFCPKEYLNIKDEEIIVWVDPLDGTTDFAKGFLESVTVLIGIAVNGKAIAGVIHQPFYNYKIETEEKNIGRTIWGIVGLGAFGYNTKLEKNQDLLEKEILDRKLSLDSKNQLIIASTKSHRNKKIVMALEYLKPSKIICVGGAGHKCLLVLEGIADTYFYPSFGCNKWDTCAPNAIINSVGGTFTDINGLEYQYHQNVDYKNLTGILTCRSLTLHKWIIQNFPSELKNSLVNQL